MKTQPPIRQFLVEEMFAEWIPEERRRALVERLALEERGAERLGEIARSNEEILDSYPPRLMAAQIEQRYREGHRPMRLSLRIVLPILASVSVATVLVWLLLPGATQRALDPSKTSDVIEEHVLLKGDPQLIIQRLRGSRAERVQHGGAVASGDRLQLEYNAAEARYGMIFSIDGRGAVSLHYPSGPNESTALTPGGAHALPFSYELDDAPNFERFFLVWSHKPIAVDAVLAVAQGLGSNRTAQLTLPNGLEVTECLLLKSTHERRR